VKRGCKKLCFVGWEEPFFLASCWREGARSWGGWDGGAWAGTHAAAATANTTTIALLLLLLLLLFGEDIVGEGERKI
jgi:hypothetical protein